MKEDIKVLLDNLLEKSIEQFAIRIQKNMKRYVYRNRYLKLKQMTRYLQNHMRMHLTYLDIKNKAKARLEREREPA